MFALGLFLLAGTMPSYEMPSAASVDGVMELTRSGELFLLPKHNAKSFKALLITQAPGKCKKLEDAMLDVRAYPKRWEQMTKVEVHEEKNGRVHYSYELDVMFSPRMEGVVERPGPGHIRFVSDKFESDFSWHMKDVRGKCHMVHSMVQEPGMRSDFVRLVEKLEPGASDAAELAGALAAARGWSQPSAKASKSKRAQEAWDVLSGAGTIIHLVDRPKKARMLVQARKRVRASPKRVIALIQDRAGYEDGLVKGTGGVDFLSDVDLDGDTTEWTVSYFGGRVSFDTRGSEKGSPHKAGGWSRTERVTDGDLDDGQWTWTVRRVPGGTAVDLTIDLDITQGSLVLATLARQDKLIARTNALQLALEFMRVVVPHPVLPTPSAPVAAAQ